MWACRSHCSDTKISKGLLAFECHSTEGVSGCRQDAQLTCENTLTHSVGYQTRRGLLSGQAQERTELLPDSGQTRSKRSWICVVLVVACWLALRLRLGVTQNENLASSTSAAKTRDVWVLALATILPLLSFRLLFCPYVDVKIKTLWAEPTLPRFSEHAQSFSCIMVLKLDREAFSQLWVRPGAKSACECCCVFVLWWCRVYSREGQT